MRGRLHVGLAEELLHRDEIAIIVEQIAGDGAMNGMSKDEIITRRWAGRHALCMVYLPRGSPARLVIGRIHP